jgi:hypothetical protein
LWADGWPQVVHARTRDNSLLRGKGSERVCRAGEDKKRKKKKKKKREREGGRRGGEERSTRSNGMGVRVTTMRKKVDEVSE